MNNKSRKLKNEYLRKWRADHKDSVKKYNNDYWCNKVKKNKEEENNELSIKSISSKEIEAGNEHK